MIDISKVKDDKETILRLRRIWWGMKTRCYNKNDREYKYYGQRGIVISDEWHIFENFKNWSLNNGYDNNLTIDRIDVNGNYCPENCRWVSMNTQMRNTRRNINIIYEGDSYCLTDLCKKLNISMESVRSLARSRNISIEDAITLKLTKKYNKHTNKWESK